MDRPDSAALRELAQKVDDKDVEWFAARYRAGDFAWVEDEIGPRYYSEMGSRIDAGDIGWVGTALATLNLDEFVVAGPLLDKSGEEVEEDEPVVIAPVVKPKRERKPRDYGWLKKIWWLIPLLIGVGLIAFLLSKCGGDDGDDRVNLVETPGKVGNLTKWSEAVQASGVADRLKGADNLTVFAPTDEAFNALGAETVTLLFSNTNVLAEVVNYHIVEGELHRVDLKSGPLTTLQGSAVTMTVAGDSIMINDANVLSEREATNGVVHNIDKVLLPPGIDLSKPARGTITARSALSGSVTMTGDVGTEAARTGLRQPMEAALQGRVVDQLTIDPTAPTGGFTLNLVGQAREDDAVRLRAAVGSLAGITVNDQLEIVVAPRLEIDINALLAAEPIQFDTGSSTIRPASNATLDKVAELLKANPAGNVLIEGHTDSVGSAATNTRLSQARAEAVQTALTSRGVAAARLSAKGYGPQRPVADNKTADGRQRNRRVEVLVTV